MSEFKLGPKQEKWLQALESGEYKQCGGELRSFGGFCCLGVADEVLELGETHAASLFETYTEIGLHSDLGRLIEPYQDCRSLAAMNDCYNSMTFKEIAQYIRANPENVFMESK